MSQLDGEHSAGFFKMLTTTVEMAAKTIVALVLLAFLHNLFTIDIHINHARREFAVQVMLNDLPHPSMAKVLKLINRYFCARSSFT